MALNTVWTENGLSNVSLTFGMGLTFGDLEDLGIKFGDPLPIFHPNVVTTVWTDVTPA